MTVARGGRQVLLHGMTFVLAGLFWGIVLPHTPYPRLALSAHIEFVANGILYIIAGVLLLKLPHGVGSKSVGVMLLAAWATWTLVLSEAVNSWWGATQLLSIAGHEAGAPGAAPWQEMIIKATHIGPALILIVAWTLLLIGFLKTPVRGSSANDEND